jgi:hypothetical protein
MTHNHTLLSSTEMDARQNCLVAVKPAGDA